MPTIGELVGGKYRVVARLGAGGMGVVFEALHVATEKRVALKCLHPEIAGAAEAVARLEREAKATGRIDHPNVVAVHDCGEHEGQLYLVMELLSGAPLRWAMRGGRSSPEAMCRLLFPVLRGVAAAHAAGVLHRDLKPENIFLVDSPDGLDPLPKVLDFGLARFHDGAAHASLSAHGLLLGTYGYMAPEQLRAQPELDQRVDVYALGVLAYELLTGELPYRADNPVDLALRILESEAPSISDHVPALPSALARVVARALARDRSARFPSVADFAGALEPFAGGLMFRGSSGARACALSPETAGANGAERREGAASSALGTPLRVAASRTERRRSLRSYGPYLAVGLALVLLTLVLSALAHGPPRAQTALPTSPRRARSPEARAKDTPAADATGSARARGAAPARLAEAIAAPSDALRPDAPARAPVNDDWSQAEQTPLRDTLADSSLPLAPEPPRAVAQGDEAERAQAPSGPAIAPEPARAAPAGRPDGGALGPSTRSRVSHGARAREPQPQPLQQGSVRVRAGGASSALKLDEF